jgi:xanthine dehydrogenase accessory factor
MRLADLSALNAERAARRAAVLVTDLGDGSQRLVREADIAADPLAAELDAALRKGRSGPLEAGERKLFLTVTVPPVTLVIIGAVHVSQALVPMARLLGLDAVVIDPRTAFATPERFPETRVLAQWPQEALPSIGGLDRYKALVCLTHDPKIDDPAITAGLEAGCFYVGALGSRRTHAKRLERLGQAGLAQQALDRIHAPIGLDIGAISPAEIALSVMGEIVLAQRLGSRQATGAPGAGA